MVIAEALHAGLPVIASREAAQAAGFDDDERVTVFDDPDGLAGAIKRAYDARLAHPARRAPLASTLPRWSESVASFQRLLARSTT